MRIPLLLLAATLCPLLGMAQTLTASAELADGTKGQGLQRAGEDNAVMLPYFADRPGLLPRITANPPLEAELRSILLAYNTAK